jgi:putative mycofactocin binding protein MftB
LSLAPPPEQTAPAFDLELGWRLHQQVALRDEPFGALAYHFGTRRLHFLKSRRLVELVTSLERYESGAAAVAALVPLDEQPTYSRALARLADSGVIDAR